MHAFDSREVRYAALATDYDGTLARGGTVDAASLRALRDLRRAGWNLVLVTGRHLEILASILPELWLFDRVVAENGAVVAASGREPVVLAPPPPARFLDALGHRGVTFKAGRVMVDTVVENERAVKEAIAEIAGRSSAEPEQGVADGATGRRGQGLGAAGGVGGVGRDRWRDRGRGRRRERPAFPGRVRSRLRLW
jgi:hypothetical protein